MSNYPTNLTDKQWQVIKKYSDNQRKKAKTFLTRGYKRSDVHHKDRLPVAHASP